MNHSIFSDCKGSAFFKCGHLFSAEVIPVLFTDFRIFANEINEKEEKMKADSITSPIRKQGFRASMTVKW